MAFSTIEILALILIIVSAVKILFLLISPKGWFKFAKGFWKNTVLARIISLILAVIVFYFLMLSMSVVQILAVTLFVALLFAVGLSGRLNDLMRIYDKQIKSGNLWRENWLYIVLWVILLVWGVIELFF